MPIAAAEELAAALRPLFATRDPFMEARRVGLVLSPNVRASGRYIRAPNAALTRGEVQYDPSASLLEQRYCIARAVLACVLGEGGQLRQLSRDVPLGELVYLLFDVHPTDHHAAQRPVGE